MSCPPPFSYERTKPSGRRCPTQGHTARGGGSSSGPEFPQLAWVALSWELSRTCVIQGQVFPAGSRPQLTVSSARNPFLGLGPLAAEIRLIPPLVEILVARTVSGTHNPTHSEWPQTGAWQCCPHLVLHHLPNCCPSLEHYLKSRRRAPPALPQLEGTLQTMVGWRCPAC